MGEMREILFRGKRISDGEWVEGYLGVEVGGAPVIEYCGTDEDVGDYVEEQFVNPESIGEFTGLTDKNGTRVFENDIVTVYYNPKYVGVSKDRVGNFAVVFHDGCFMKRKITNPMSGDAGLYHFIQSDEFEVIGNIYDNPELIESQL